MSCPCCGEPAVAADAAYESVVGPTTSVAPLQTKFNCQQYDKKGCKGILKRIQTLLLPDQLELLCQAKQRA